MGNSNKILFKISESKEINSHNINRGKPIYYENILHYIVYEFSDNMIISLSEDLSKVFCVKKSKTFVKPTKK